MQAIVYHRYGGPEVLQLEEIETPVPGDDEVLIRMRAASVNPADWHFLRGDPYAIRLITGLRKPKNPRFGSDVAGRIEAVGKSVTRFKPGDEVFGSGRGAFAESVCAPESKVAGKPGNISFEQAASVPIAGITALQALRDKGRIESGQHVLINGAAGGVGTFAVQIAKSFGTDVTGVCSTRNVEMVRSIGADRVIDYSREDFTAGGERYDVIVDCFASHSFAECRRVLKSGGIYVAVGGPVKSIIPMMAGAIGGLVVSRFGSRKFVLFMARLGSEHLSAMRDLMERGQVRPVIDRTYALSEVPEAVRYLEEGHARGKVVIAVADAGTPGGRR